MIHAELGEDLEADVMELVASGRFSSEGEVLVAAVTLLRRTETRLQALDETLERRVGNSSAGSSMSVDEAFEAVRSGE